MLIYNLRRDINTGHAQRTMFVLLRCRWAVEKGRPVPFESARHNPSFFKLAIQGRDLSIINHKDTQSRYQALVKGTVTHSSSICKNKSSSSLPTSPSLNVVRTKLPDKRTARERKMGWFNRRRNEIVSRALVPSEIDDAVEIELIHSPTVTSRKRRKSSTKKTRQPRARNYARIEGCTSTTSNDEIYALTTMASF